MYKFFMLIGEVTPNASLGQFLNDVGTVFTKCISFIGDVFGIFTSNPILLTTFGFFFAGGVIGLAMRFLRRA